MIEDYGDYLVPKPHVRRTVPRAETHPCENAFMLHECIEQYSYIAKNLCKSVISALCAKTQSASRADEECVQISTMLSELLNL